jgi:hypothetical protein
MKAITETRHPHEGLKCSLQYNTIMSRINKNVDIKFSVDDVFL